MAADAGPGGARALVADLRRATKQLTTAPWSGISLTSDARGRRRKLALQQSRYLLFYEVDELAEELWALRVWHMSRGERPKL
ncbi:MAG: type II toxin-antitoxin system RelE/ParE family toxin [Myxococcaceae bacterium]|nr:type II toxin-antitoxin system RelE/ParE family toxin [Myxococcaceae bacterium]